MNQIIINIVLLCLIGLLFLAIIFNRQLQLKDDLMFSRAGTIAKMCADLNDTYPEFKACVKYVDEGLE